MTELGESTEPPGQDPALDISSQPIEVSPPPETWASGEAIDVATVDELPASTEDPLPDPSAWGGLDSQELLDGAEDSVDGEDESNALASDSAFADSQGIPGLPPASWAGDQVVAAGASDTGAQAADGAVAGAGQGGDGVSPQLAELQTPDATEQVPSDQPAELSLPKPEQPGTLEAAEPNSEPTDHPTQVPGADVLGFEPSASKTDVGYAFFNPNDKISETTKDVPEYPGEYVMDLHGSPTSVSVPGSDGVEHSLTPTEFAALVKNGTDWNGEPIRLFSCETGQQPDGFAQQLADELGVPVTAPTEEVSPNPQGKDYPAIIESPAPKPKFGGILPLSGKQGEWKTFTPGGKAVS